MANLTGLGLAPLPIARTVGVMMPLSVEEPSEELDSFFHRLENEGVLRYALDVAQMLYQPTLDLHGVFIGVAVHELGERAKDSKLEQLIGVSHGMSKLCARRLLWNIFSSEVIRSTLCTSTGKNAVRLIDTGVWLIWFWQEERKSWYIQMTNGKSDWQPGDHIGTRVSYDSLFARKAA